MNRLLAFLAIIKTGSFTAAARELGYTQSAVSQMINALEEELGVKLLARSQHHVQLTPAGKQLLPLIRQASKDWQTTQERAAEIRGLKSAVVRIGTIESISAHWLPRLIRGFRQLHPTVQFVMLQGDYTTIPQWVADNEVDFGFCNPLARPDIDVRYIKSGDLRAILPADHPLARREFLTLQDLAQEPYLMLEEGLYSEPLAAFGAAGIEPNIVTRIHDDFTIMSMVEAGLGFSILAELVLQKQSYHIRAVPLHPNLQRQIGIVQRNPSLMPIASQQFIDYMLAHRDELP
ncbi:LysR family transcriptional regulator [Limosilactobacillus kribbianus]|uniref:LysR family transcriptional regulator n=1 Tax=Limosilactobacillus kribbianus TaxID=2982695 RepID=UPI0022642290|nr:LysR family transcriptional regulator [Limosilactobacillus kribbianus]